MRETGLTVSLFGSLIGIAEMINFLIKTVKAVPSVYQPPNSSIMLLIIAMFVCMVGIGIVVISQGLDHKQDPKE